MGLTQWEVEEEEYRNTVTHGLRTREWQVDHYEMEMRGVWAIFWGINFFSDL